MWHSCVWLHTIFEVSHTHTTGMTHFLDLSKSLCYIGYTSAWSDVHSCVLMQEATTCSIFWDGISFQHLATVFISVFTLCYVCGLLFRGPPWRSSCPYWHEWWNGSIIHRNLKFRSRWRSVSSSTFRSFYGYGKNLTVPGGLEADLDTVLVTITFATSSTNRTPVIQLAVCNGHAWDVVTWEWLKK